MLRFSELSYDFGLKKFADDILREQIGIHGTDNDFLFSNLIKFLKSYREDARVMWDQKTGRSRGFGFVRRPLNFAFWRENPVRLYSF
ncbi:putative nucleotide-binding alpha-beta plait domain superfamily [Helianthus anomalus]